MRNLSRREVVAAGAGIVPLVGLAGLTRAQQAVPDNAGASLDPLMSACQLITGRKQIEVCRFALEHIQDDAVKQFAQTEIEEHELIQKRLAELGFQYPAAAGSAPGAGQAAAVAVGRASLPPGMAEAVTLDHEVGQQCIATAKAELGQLQGHDFDKRFVGYQLDAHYGLFDHGVVFRRHASQQMAPVLDEARPIIERHIATCKQLMDRLDAQKRDG